MKNRFVLRLLLYAVTVSFLIFTGCSELFYGPNNFTGTWKRTVSSGYYTVVFKSDLTVEATYVKTSSSTTTVIVFDGTYTYSGNNADVIFTTETISGITVNLAYYKLGLTADCSVSGSTITGTMTLISNGVSTTKSLGTFNKC